MSGAASNSSSRSGGSASGKSETSADIPRIANASEAIFLEAFENILVEDPVRFTFPGSISRKAMRGFWRWVTRDLIKDLAGSFSAETMPAQSPAQKVDFNASRIINAANNAVGAAGSSADAQRRLTVQLGGEDVFERLPHILAAFRNRAVFDRALAFGRAANSLTDEPALATALRSLPLKDPTLAAFLFHIIVGSVLNPSRLVSAIVSSGTAGTEQAIKGAGFEPLIEGLFAHAQSRVAAMQVQTGLPPDIEMICRPVETFHKMMRGVGGYLELSRGSRWSLLASEMTREISAVIEVRLRTVSIDVNQSLRRGRDGIDRVDPDRLDSARDGIQLLCTVRECRDSLALNALFDRLWTETGQNLEMLLMRNLELFKENPSDQNAALRLDGALKMAALRYGHDYAENIRKVRDNSGRRASEAS